MAYGSSSYGRFEYGADAFQPIEITGGGDSNFASELNAIGGGSCDFASTIKFLAALDGGGSGDFASTLSFLVDAGGGGSIATTYSLTAAIVDLACYVLGIDTQRTFQFANYGFLGYGRFNQIFLGVKADGLYDLETAAPDDDGTDIAASFEIKSDFGLPNYKRFRSIYIEGGNAKITITDENGNVVANNITVEEFRGLPRSTRDKAFTIKVENINGEKITIHRIHGDLDVFERKGV